MTALACLRILIDPDRAAAGGETLAALVSKVADAFLESRWRWPRRHGPIAAYAFLLADPRATELDALELSGLSDELQLKLFGSSEAGAICMAMLEGEQEMVTRFAAIDPVELRRVLKDGGTIEGVTGRMTEITPQGARVVSPPDQAGPMKTVAEAAQTAARTPSAVSPMARRTRPPPDDGIEASFRAVWCTLKDSFVGSGLVARQRGARGFYSIIDGPAERPHADHAADFDVTCIKAAPRALVGSQGLLFLPISFSSTVQKSAREAYAEVLEFLPQHDRPRLAAAVYDVPRAPTFAAINQLKAFLNPYFGFVDLQVTDPGFQIEALMMEAVNSVTLSLPDVDEGSRMAAATRFMANRDAYQRRRIWCAITNVRTRRELDFCVRLRTPFLSGKAVSDHLVAPAEPVKYAVARMPLRETTVATMAQQQAVAS
ncbi:MAG: hypothetical protein HY859_04010 [Caulobacterales bacterium]|nr:hypothetical protein [Caulobacterales bacterium]